MRAAALAADEPFTPVRDDHLGTLALGHLGRIELDLVRANDAVGTIAASDEWREAFVIGSFINRCRASTSR
ncbi:MAG: hypothetical protein JO081_01105 [Alphaproteobacteria bacterium]|nr:hypothetical protein [Alphaproteobacteria bacterium]